MRVYSYAELEALWVKVGGAAALAPTMAAIALAESSGRSSAVGGPNRDGTYDFGCWQINSSHGYDRAQLLADDQTYNARAALAIYRSQGLAAWRTWTTGAYRAYLQGAAAPGANASPTRSSPAMACRPVSQADFHEGGGGLIGWPYQGSHSRAVNCPAPSCNWESMNAIDVPVLWHSPIYACADGQIGLEWGTLGATTGRFEGKRLHLISATNEFYYAHLDVLYAQRLARVKAGDVLGLSGKANGVMHLHFASHWGNPQTLWTNAPWPSHPIPAPPGTTPGTIPPPSPITPTGDLEREWRYLTSAWGRSLPDDVAHAHDTAARLLRVVSS